PATESMYAAVAAPLLVGNPGVLNIVVATSHAKSGSRGASDRARRASRSASANAARDDCGGWLRENARAASTHGSRESVSVLAVSESAATENPTYARFATYHARSFESRGNRRTSESPSVIPSL